MHYREAFPLGEIVWLKGIHYLFKFRCIKGFEIKMCQLFFPPASAHLLLMLACSVLRHFSLGTRPCLSRLGSAQLVWGCPPPCLGMIPAGIKDLPAKPKENPYADACHPCVPSKTCSALRRISLVTLKNLPAHAPGHNVALPRCLTGTLLHLFLVLLKFFVPSHLAVTSSGLLLGGSTKMPSLGVRGTTRWDWGLRHHACYLVTSTRPASKHHIPLVFSLVSQMLCSCFRSFSGPLYQYHLPTSSAFPAPLLSLSGSWHTVRILLQGSS